MMRSSMRTGSSSTCRRTGKDQPGVPAGIGYASCKPAYTPRIIPRPSRELPRRKSFSGRCGCSSNRPSIISTQRWQKRGIATRCLPTSGLRTWKPWPRTTDSSNYGRRIAPRISRPAPRWSAQRSHASKAASSTPANGFVNNEALANELAARFYAARGFEKIAHAYLQEARYCYLRWGAAGKVRQLDQLHPRLKEEEPVPGPTSTIGASVEHLDLATVIKVSQAVSGEIVLEKLIDTLMRTAIEHAGAERGLLILPRGVEQRIEAEATTSGDTVIVRLREASVAVVALPESIVHYVVRTRESVILEDASAENPFSADTYIRQHHARSVLCLPLINQAKLIGVLYLENNLTPHAFNPTRIAVLKLLASQAAISLENTRLYGDLEEREAKIRRLVDANIIGICLWHLDGRIL